MQAVEKYLFDLNGYLIVEDVLDQQRLAAIRAAIERHPEAIGPRESSLAYGAAALLGSSVRKEADDMHQWAEPDGALFRSLLSLPKLVPYLNELLGPGFRVDHPMQLFVMEQGCEGFHLHGPPGSSFDPAEFYHHKNGRMYCGLCVVELQLEEVRAGDGGLVVVPGSHKSNFDPPRELMLLEHHREQIRQLVLPAGSAVIFTEALTHGALPWRAERPRRCLLTRYNRATMAYVPAPAVPEGATDRERAVLEPPYHPRLNRPRLDD